MPGRSSCCSHAGTRQPRKQASAGKHLRLESKENPLSRRQSKLAQPVGAHPSPVSKQGVVGERVKLDTKPPSGEDEPPDQHTREEDRHSAVMRLGEESTPRSR